MLQSSTLHFLKELKENNNREWFETNRKRYENAKTDYIEMIGKVLIGVSKNDPTLASLEPKDCIFRIGSRVW